jgi:hydrogenase nickel incorporation protein HypA/HybF
VIKDALLSAYNLAREVEGCKDSELVIEETPLVIFCHTCGSEQPALSVQELACAKCNTPAQNVVAGRELDVVALEIQ